jgi:hypothetical protein
MILLSDNQIGTILDTVKRNHIIYVAGNVGYDVLSDYDKSVLKSSGIDVEKFKGKMSSFEQAYMWGILSKVLEHQQATDITYDQFLTYLDKGQYIPPTRRENEMLHLAKQKTYDHIKNLSRGIEDDIKGMIAEQNKKLAIREEIERGIEGRKSVGTITREIGRRTKDWEKNFGRIVETEWNNVFQEGRAMEVIEKYGDEALVYKEVFPGACRHCIRLYLTEGIGSKPKLFKVSQLVENGTNIGRKVEDWVPTLGSVHPYCRCILYHVNKGKEWDEEKKDFTYPEKTEQQKDYKRNIERRVKNKLIVGDKEYWI